MITDFIIYNAQTVPDNYTWDNYTPLDGANIVNAYATTEYTSGYAPGLKVLFSNSNSQSDSGYGFVNYIWDFGDYYHDTNNIVSLDCTSLVEHTYIMPGTYTVTLRHVQSRNEQIIDPSSFARLCLGKYDTNWYWNNLMCGEEQQTTWDQTMCFPPATATPPRPKWWDEETQCFQKYCKYWSWYDLANYSDSANPIRWEETVTEADFEKLWMFESNETPCKNTDLRYLNTFATQEQTLIKPFIVEVKEIPPIAEIVCVTVPTGATPHTVILSPTGCKPGSFPIDRIDWDFGDGSPIVTHTRYAPPSGSNVQYNGQYLSDINDVRNYNVIHTYVRDANTYPVFYPSLTCYSANTNTQDSCSTTIGPIEIHDLPDTNLIKARNTLKGNLYAFDIGGSVAFSTTVLASSQTVLPTIPQNRLLINSSTTNSSFGYANDNNDYPPIYTPACTVSPLDLIPTVDILTTEDSNPLSADLIVDLEDGVPILTDTDLYIEP